MMNYYIEKDETSNSWKVIERPTQQTIKENLIHQEAKRFLRHYNLGGGFDGWSPTFLLKKVGMLTK